MSRNPALAARNIGLKIVRRALRLQTPVVRAARRAQRVREQLGHHRDELRITRAIAAVARGRAPIVAGPWLGEVGYEALYWIPFLRWFEDVFRIDPQRIVALSRGGVDQWYSGLAGRYVDLFDFFTLKEFVERNATRRSETEGGGQKQSGLGVFDREILARVQRHFGYSEIHVFHPALLFRLFRQFWLGNRSIDYLWQHTRFERHPPPPPAALDLPAEYVAAKFYTGTALPDSDATRRALRTLVSRIAEQRPVVVLDAGIVVDEHRDYLFDGLPNVRTLHGTLTPRVNLGIQTEVIAGAQQFIGTCGSLAWLAPMLGVPTVAVFADDRLLTPHLLVARQAYRAAGAARFTTLDLRAGDRLHLLEGRLR
ncbi:MAG: hypothetical protein HYX77_06870 [Acidobacteria bacterium]|nr:hypothetical protein [Acidobacteriota bacterium]